LKHRNVSCCDAATFQLLTAMLPEAAHLPLSPCHPHVFHARVVEVLASSLFMQIHFLSKPWRSYRSGLPRLARVAEVRPLISSLQECAPQAAFRLVRFLSPCIPTPCTRASIILGLIDPRLTAWLSIPVAQLHVAVSWLLSASRQRRWLDPERRRCGVVRLNI
jgi:hypothetical protein